LFEGSFSEVRRETSSESCFQLRRELGLEVEVELEPRRLSTSFSRSWFAVLYSSSRVSSCWIRSVDVLSVSI
jgi:hypothetical protein